VTVLNFFRIIFPWIFAETKLPSALGKTFDYQKIMATAFVNDFVRKHMKTIEMVAVLMRILSFSLVSWLGSRSPFMFIWSINTIDAFGLSWCAILKKDKAYTLLNVFWMVIGAVGICRAAGLF
jgi:hypothetical protein